MIKNKFWRVWCYSLGQKQGRSDKEADGVAIIRTAILAFYMITNAFIVYGVVRTHIIPTEKECPRTESYPVLYLDRYY